MSDEPVISTKERPGDYDALETAKPGEPIFTLQGGDPFAPATIMHWASLARAAGIAETNGDKAAKLLKKAGAAEHVAWAFQDYQRGIVDEAPAQHDGSEQAVSMAKLADRLYNAEGEACTVAEALEAGGSQNDKAVILIRQGMALIKDAAKLFEPRRHLQRDAS